MSNRTFTFIGALFIGLLVFPFIPQVFSSTLNRQTNDVSRSPVEGKSATRGVPVTVAPVQSAPRKPPIMTQGQFNQIGSGMSYAQCVQLIGCEGERTQTAGSDGEAEYKWQLVNTPSRNDCTGEATVKFRNGIFYGKGIVSNTGRIASASALNMSTEKRPTTPPYICRSVYDAIKDGSGYAECVRLLGVEGRYLGRRQMSMGALSVNGTFVPVIADFYVWHNPSIPATLTLSFRNGKLTGKEISSGR